MEADNAQQASDEPENGRKRSGSRAKLMAAARKLFVERGYHETRPQDISKVANVGHGTFYFHFKDKRECFFAFVEQAGEDLEQEIRNEIDGIDDLEGQIRGIFVALHNYAETSPGVLTAAVSDTEIIARSDEAQESLTQRWARQWAHRLQKQAARGEVDESFNVDVLGAAIGAVIREGSLTARRKGISQDELISTLTKFVVRGLRPED